MPFFTEIWLAFHGIVASSDRVTMAIMLVIAIGAGALMRKLESIITVTFVALIAFALFSYAKGVLVGHRSATDFALMDWQAFQNLHMLTLVAYAIGFAAIILAVYLARSAIDAVTSPR
ncbi:MAG TPA: hypothetical protein VGU69_11750 [Rhizomicrobium sp.]|nr:hypothetical protein [Rhizomicrobium sp.]